MMAIIIIIPAATAPLMLLRWGKLEMLGLLLSISILLAYISALALL